MSSFREIGLKGIYRTATNSLIKDFYLPVLSSSVRYDRAVGFFSASSLTEAAFGISGLIRRGGKMRLVIGHPLSDEDWEAVKEGERLKGIQQQILKDLVEMLERAGSDRTVHSLELLSWLVATGSIEIRFAFRRCGMYHEKIGVMEDDQGQRIVFHGSANESANALLPTRNFESLAVYPSWNVEVFAEYGEPFVNGFEALWTNTTPDVLSVPVPSSFYESLVAFRGSEAAAPDLEFEQCLARDQEVYSPAPTPRLPAVVGGIKYGLKEHQQHALQKWASNSYSGILALATGAGKTITALHAATRFSEQKYPLFLVIAVPYQVLGEQWTEVMSHFGMRPHRAFYARESWYSDLDLAVSSFCAGACQFLSVVVVNDTLATDEFQALIARIPSSNLFFVGDECHHHSSPAWLQKIPINAKFKLGLSATPWNPNRLENRARLESLYGPVVATYSLRDALEHGVLCAYEYHWLPCSFEDDEADEYERLSAAISALVAQADGNESPSIRIKLQSLASRRSRLLGALRGKFARLGDRLAQVRPGAHSLFYCGEGQHPLDADGSGERNVDKVTALLASRTWKVGRITASETVADRRRVLDSFSDGFIEAVAAIRVLDEGFDIPSCRTAYLLASSSSHRQYVQRRGRVLRRAPGKTHATIFDFVAIAPPERLQSNAAIWRRQVETELVRVREFVQLARNSESQELSINREMEQLGLGSIFYAAEPVDEEELYGDQ